MGGSRRESRLAAGGGKREEFPPSPRKWHQKSPSWAARLVCRRCSWLFLALPVNPTHTEPACCFPQLCLRRGLRRNGLSALPQQELRGHLDFKEQPGSWLNWKLFLAEGRRGLVPGRHPQLCPPVLSVGMLENRIPGGPRGMSAWSRAWESARGVFWRWVGGREGKGGCKLREKVRRAINKWHPGKEMSVCGSSDTPAPEMGRERVRMVVIWGIKSMESRPGQQQRGLSFKLVGWSVAVVLLGLLLRVLLQPSVVWAHISHKLPRGPGSWGPTSRPAAV